MDLLRGQSLDWTTLEQIVKYTLTSRCVSSFRSLAAALPVVAAAMLLLVSPLPVRAADAVPMLLSSPAATDASRANTKAQAAERSVARRRAVSVNFEHIDPSSGNAPTALGVELFDGVIVTLDLDRIEKRGPGNFTWTGRVRGYDRSQAILTVVNGQIAGTITLSDTAARTTATYQIQSDPNGTQSLRQLNPSGFPADHPAGSESLHAPAHTKSKSLSLDAASGDFTLKAGTTAADTGATVDVMVVYSKQTAAAAGTAIGAQIQQAIDSANAAYANSGIATRLNLVHVEAVAYDESGDFNTDLNRLTSGSDGYMDNVATLRNTHAADLVSLFIENGQYCGLAWVGPSASYGFSVINRGCASGNLTFAHELGHNFGALHDPYVDPSTSPYAYGHGYAVPAAGWRTVMAYTNVCSAAGTSCTRIPYFSNPSLTYGTAALPLGTTSTSDNARVHNQSASTVANFRSSGTSGCTFAFSPSSANVAATATSGSASVTAGTGCAWNTTSNASWLTVAAGSGVSGTGTLNYAAAANSGPARSGTVVVGGVNFTVSQASGCSYALSSSSASLAASGGTGSVTLAAGAGCTWTASSSASWLTISSAKSGSGSATVSYAASANTTTSVRSANLTIGGATFVVTEAAPAAVVALSATLANAGFEALALGTNGFQYQPTTTGWVFNSKGGIQRNGSAWGAAAAPEGQQTAFLQGGSAQMAQTLNLPAGTYRVSFYAARRAYQGIAQPLQLSIDGIAIGTPISPTSTAFALYTSASFTVNAGSHTLRFTTTNPTGDNTAFVDAVSLNPLTAPAATTGIVSSAHPAAAGSSITFTATVSGNNPTGNVAFADGSSNISGCAAVALAGSGNSKTATCTTSSLTVGSHNIVARYAGDTNNLSSSSTPLMQTIDPVAVAVDIALANAGFEALALGTNGFQYQPTTTGWVFNSKGGIQRNGSAWGAAAAPEGQQTAFLQGGSAQMAQTLNLPAGTYRVSFYAARRAYQGIAQPLQLSIDGIAIGTPISPTSTAFALYTSASFTVNAGSHTLRFTTTNPTGDNTAFVDAVTLKSMAGP